MKHDNCCSSNDNFFVSQRRRYAKHWSIPLVESSKCNGHSISLRVCDSAVCVGRGGGKRGGGETPGSCVHFLHVLGSEKLPIN